jgi:predicted transcriptional regulator
MEDLIKKIQQDFKTKKLHGKPLTMYRLALEADMPQSTIHRIMNGENLNPRISTIYKIMEALDNFN